MAVVALILGAALLAGCGSSSAAQKEKRVIKDGDSVSVHYRGTLDNGEEFDSSAGREPLQFVVGTGQVISGFDDAVRGLAVGEKRTVRLEPAQAYGEHRADRMVTVPASSAPQGLTVGMQVSLGGQPAKIVAVTPTEVTVDANHPLAGQALTFEVEVVSIN